jgi:hypothetical protein
LRYRSTRPETRTGLLPPASTSSRDNPPTIFGDADEQAARWASAVNSGSGIDPGSSTPFEVGLRGIDHCSRRTRVEDPHDVEDEVVLVLRVINPEFSRRLDPAVTILGVSGTRSLSPRSAGAAGLPGSDWATDPDPDQRPAAARRRTSRRLGRRHPFEPRRRAPHPRRKRALDQPDP